jgi:polygalacturonase
MPQPTVPDKTFNVTDYGAVGDGKTLDTTSIQKALDACRAAGGGMVRIPAGHFVTAPIKLCSNLDFHLDKDAVLSLVGYSQYPRTQRGYQDGISISGGHDIQISGQGTIDGNGQTWWWMYRKQAGAPAAAGEAGAGPLPPDIASLPHRPFLVAIRDCSRVLVRDVLLTNSPMFHLVPQGCRDVVIDNVRIEAPANAPNTDGIDPAGWNFLITHCTIDVGDDCIAVKPSHRGGALQPTPDSLSCENFTITNCTFKHGHGMSIGNPSAGGLRHMIVRDCSFDSTDAGIRMKSHRGAGNVVEDLTYENLKMKNVKVAILITSYYPRIPSSPQDDPAEADDSAPPIWRHIRISNVTSEGGGQAGRIVGLAEMHISDVVFDHVNLSARTGMQIVFADKIQFVDSHVAAETGPALMAHDADVSGLEQ